MKTERPWMAPLSAKRMSQLLRQHEKLAVFKNTDGVLVGDLVVMIKEIRAARRDIKTYKRLIHKNIKHWKW